ncbi:MAG: hypothetical protein LAT75_05785 [Candidatus Cyclonatronum sp.]|uniref:hypothetical protein n=1 Tax=Cyclonatronum sp. TaxID=3024185 RepID=UPI0025BDF7CA|nr:hypothetical protein [Cyclonatronum sp.]MCH8486356.1 hypothetical protein [Cyclonatronum sp.]
MSSYVERTPFSPSQAGKAYEPFAGNPASVFGERMPVADTPAKPQDTFITAAAAKKQAAKKQEKKSGVLKIYGILFAVGLLAMAYITHQYAMQQLLDEVGQSQRELDRVQMIHEARVLRYQQLTGPSEVFSRARAQGFEHIGPADFVIERGR